jgi:Domain of unknown function (DUF4114)/PEP-CTERM motif
MKGRHMGNKKVVWGSVLVVSLFGPVAAFADTISRTAGAAFQSWVGTNLNQNGKLYWDNTSLDGTNKNVGFFLVNAPTAPLAGAPGALPYWGNTFNSVTDSGGTPDLNFTFQRTDASSLASLKLEVAHNANINEFGWYNTTDPSVLHPIFLGPDSAPSSDAFSPSAQYGLYLKGADGTYFSQSSLNPSGDTSHQHFAIFQESSTTGAESYWIGIEDLGVSGLGGAENGVGDYNDMVVRISALAQPAIPEPSTVVLVLGGCLLLLVLRKRRRSIPLM